MKNVFFILLASILAFGAVACSNDQATNATAEPAGTATPATAAAPLLRRMWHRRRPLRLRLRQRAEAGCCGSSQTGCSPDV